MKIRSLLVLAIVVAMGAAPRPEGKKEDKDAVQGSWTFASGEHNGQPPTDDVKAMRLTFKDDRLTATLREEVKEEGKFRLDPAKKPKEMTFTPSQGKVVRGLYELDGDTLKLCLGPPDGDFPTEFSGREGTRCAVLVLKRVK